MPGIIPLLLHVLMGTKSAGFAYPVSSVIAPRDCGLRGGEMLGLWSKLLGAESLGLAPHPTRSQPVPLRNSPLLKPKG